jgi:aquaporin NIP
MTEAGTESSLDLDVPHARDEIRKSAEHIKRLPRRDMADVRKYVAEVIGTFTFVFVGTGAIVIDSMTAGGVTHVGISLAFGLAVTCMVYALGDVSGAHLNPAVTAGFCLSGRLAWRLFPGYIISQFAGAILASTAILLLFGNRVSLGATLPSGSVWQSFALESILTGILVFVVLCVTTGTTRIGTMTGIAIGGTIALEGLFASPISGASMNPARSLGPALVSGDVHALWVYLVAPLLGSALAVPLWRLTREGISQAP